MKKMKYRQVASKWVKTKALIKNQSIARHIPETRLFSKKSFMEMMNKYRKVVLKPAKGTGGSGLIFVTRIGTRYQIRYGHQLKNNLQFSSVDSFVHQKVHGNSYIIQQGIDILHVNGRPIDYRIRNEKFGHTWKTTRAIGRVARRGLSVTNLCKGGRELTLDEGLKKALRKKNVSAEKATMYRLANQCTNMMEKNFPGVRRLGYDFGLDKNGKVWIFEVNTKPA